MEYMRKLKFTEEFLWKLYEFHEGLTKVHEPFAQRSMREALHPELWEIRLAYESRKRKKTFSQFVSYLKRKGYIKIPEGKNISSFEFTEKGRQKALAGRVKGRELAERKDGKIIMLMYDIPNKKQSVRQAFRSALEFLGYQMLQKSVWVSSKDVLEETERAVREYGLDDCVNLFVIEKIKVQK